MHDNIKKLRKLTNNLPDFANIVKLRRGKTIDFKVETGKANLVSLMNMKEISIARGFCTTGTIFPEHVHKEKEFIIIVKGKCEQNVNDMMTILEPGDFIYIPPNAVHYGTCLEDIEYISFTIPASLEYPGE